MAKLRAVNAPALPQSALSLLRCQPGSAQLHGFLWAKGRCCGVHRGGKTGQGNIGVMMKRPWSTSSGGQLVFNGIIEAMAEGVDQGRGVPATVSSQCA